MRRKRKVKRKCRGKSVGKQEMSDGGGGGEEEKGREGGGGKEGCGVLKEEQYEAKGCGERRQSRTMWREGGQETRKWRKRSGKRERGGAGGAGVDVDAAGRRH